MIRVLQIPLQVLQLAGALIVWLLFLAVIALTFLALIGYWLVTGVRV